MRTSISSLLLLMSCYSSMAMGFSKPQQFETDRSDLKAVVFLSATCPCSQSHVDHLNQLESRFPGFRLYGVITDGSDATEKQLVNEYYTGERFRFSVIEDPQQNLVKKYNALKTPHVVLLKKNVSGDFETIYEGGVTNRRHFSQSEKRFLEENLVALKKGQPVPYRQGPSLGCYIRRF